MCLTQILKMLRGGGAKKAEDTTKYSRCGVVAALTPLCDVALPCPRCVRAHGSTAVLTAAPRTCPPYVGCRVGGAGDAHTDTDDQWDDVDDNWDWTADTGAAVDVEAGAGSGGGVGASGAPQASARPDVAASASPVPAGVSVTNGAPSSGNGASGIAMTTRDTGAPLRVADPVGTYCAQAQVYAPPAKHHCVWVWRMRCDCRGGANVAVT